MAAPLHNLSLISGPLPVPAPSTSRQRPPLTCTNLNSLAAPATCFTNNCLMSAAGRLLERRALVAVCSPQAFAAVLGDDLESSVADVLDRPALVRGAGTLPLFRGGAVLSCAGPAGGVEALARMLRDYRQRRRIRVARCKSCRDAERSTRAQPLYRIRKPSLGNPSVYAARGLTGCEPWMPKCASCSLVPYISRVGAAYKCSRRTPTGVRSSV
jgi:hypothetical protein